MIYTFILFYAYTSSSSAKTCLFLFDLDRIYTAREGGYREPRYQGWCRICGMGYRWKKKREKSTEVCREECRLLLDAYNPIICLFSTPSLPCLSTRGYGRGTCTG
ncbi:hypothetical protein F4818DRAFT_404203 [Hypoxylon cercidicola]|nr:hypothetical protein F4818DRAFT_404203 [Hypoxylon cercidicola]